MTDAPPEVINELNELAETRFTLEARVNAAKQRYKDRDAANKKALAEELAKLDRMTRRVDAKIWKLILLHEGKLFVKRSFATLHAKFQLTAVPASSKVDKEDVTNIMSLARKMGVVRQIAKPKVSWNFNSAKFFAWLAEHGEVRPQFEPYIQDAEAYDSLSIKPNETYTVSFDNLRLSPASITIQRPDASEAKNES